MAQQSYQTTHAGRTYLPQFGNNWNVANEGDQPIWVNDLSGEPFPFPGGRGEIYPMVDTETGQVPDMSNVMLGLLADGGKVFLFSQQDLEHAGLQLSS